MYGNRPLLQRFDVLTWSIKSTPVCTSIRKDTSLLKCSIYCNYNTDFKRNACRHYTPHFEIHTRNFLTTSPNDLWVFRSENVLKSIIFSGVALSSLRMSIIRGPQLVVLIWRHHSSLLALKLIMNLLIK